LLQQRSFVTMADNSLVVTILFVASMFAVLPAFAENTCSPTESQCKTTCTDPKLDCVKAAGTDCTLEQYACQPINFATKCFESIAECTRQCTGSKFACQEMTADAFMCNKGGFKCKEQFAALTDYNLVIKKTGTMATHVSTHSFFLFIFISLLSYVFTA